MNIELDVMENDAYANFLGSIRGSETRRGYTRNLRKFLSLIPDRIFTKCSGAAPESRGVEHLADAFVHLARNDIGAAKSIIKSYVRETNKEVEQGLLSANTVPNRIKPIKALLVSNEVDVSWGLINKMYPRETKSEDRAYTREEIQGMLVHCTDITDRLIILMFSSGGFRLEAWDYFCWKDVVMLPTASSGSAASDGDVEYRGAALRVYRGDPEEYWTFLTPEACKVLELYKKEWRSRFLRHPKDDDPLLASARFDVPRRFHQKGIKARVNKIVTKIGLRDQMKEGTRRYEVKLDHGFRKYFNTMMRRAKVNYLDKEDMMGHTTGMEKHYERYNEEDFERFSEYEKAIPFLTVSDTERVRLEKRQLEREKTELEIKNRELEDMKLEIEKIQQILDVSSRFGKQ